MSDGIYSALSGAIAQQRSLDVVANNVANANTTGFRADRLAFEEALAASGPRGPAPDALRYVAISKMQTDDTQGSLRETGNPLDVALQGDGMFVVETPQGERYTRAGAFVADAEGVVRTPDGHRVLGVPSDPDRRDRVEIRIPPGTREVGVGPDGTVTADGEQVGQFHIVRFEDPNALEKEGLTLFTQRAGTGNRTQVDDAQIVQGFLESGNINAVAGMNELITVSRSFEAFQKVIDGFRNLDERTAREVGGR